MSTDPETLTNHSWEPRVEGMGEWWECTKCGMGIYDPPEEMAPIGYCLPGRRLGTVGDLPSAPTLSEFLVARIAEDRTKARVAGNYPLWPMSRERLLAECAAKRRIVELMTFVTESWAANHGGEGRSLWPDVNRREREHAQIVLENLALPYADHPDFREEWRP